MSDPIRILMINSKMQCAGIENFIMNYYRNIDRDRVQFDFLVHYKERQHFDDEIEKMGGKIYRLSIREDFNILRYIHELISFFREHQEYRVVHGHMESFGMFYLKAAKMARVPVRIAHIHVTGTDNNLKGHLKSVMNKFFGKHANLLFACSESARDYCFPGEENVKVIHNAIDVKRFSYSDTVRSSVRRELNLDGKFVIGHVGRFFIVKNQSFLIDAFAEACKSRDDLILMLCGDGELLDEVKARAESKNVGDKVLFMGQRDDVADMYQAMDLFVLPSLSEALPFVVIEAQAAGLPCVVSTGVSEEALILPTAHRLPLCINQWSTQFTTARMAVDRACAANAVSMAGYDIVSEANKLMTYYEKLHLEGIQ